MKTSYVFPANVKKLADGPLGEFCEIFRSVRLGLVKRRSVKLKLRKWPSHFYSKKKMYKFVYRKHY